MPCQASPAPMPCCACGGGPFDPPPPPGGGDDATGSLGGGDDATGSLAEVMTRLVCWLGGWRPGCSHSLSELARTKPHFQLRPRCRSSSQASLSSDSSLAPLQRLPEWLAQRTGPRATAGTSHRRMPSGRRGRDSRHQEIARPGSAAEAGRRSQGYPRRRGNPNARRESYAAPLARHFCQGGAWGSPQQRKTTIS